MGGDKDIEDLLRRVAEGDPEAWEHLLPYVYSSLRDIAQRLMRRQKPGHTLQATALVHEAYLKLAGGRTPLESRTHFDRVAARAMRQVLVDHERARQASKRGDGWDRVMLTAEVAEVSGPGLDVLALDEALAKLQRLDPQTAEVAELRCFGGLEHDAIAQITGRSKRTVERTWRFARTWLEREMEGGAGE